MELTGPSHVIQNAKRLRREMSLPEIPLWRELRKRPDGLKFRRQHPAGRYVLDFYCDAKRIAVEVDGEAHERGNRPERDAERDAWLSRHNVRVVRVAAHEVLRDVGSVVAHIVIIARG